MAQKRPSRLSHLLVLKIGLYPEVCRDWDKNELTLKNWSLFKTQFAAVYRDLRLM